MATWTLQKLGSLFLALIVLILWLMFYYNPQGALTEVKELTSALGEYAPTIGAANVSAGKPVISREHQEAIEDLKKTILRMRDSQDQNCFAKYYRGLPELGEEGTSLTFHYDGSSTTLIVEGGVEGKQRVSSENLGSVTPCVVAGQQTGEEKEGIPARNFYDHFIAGNIPEVTINFRGSAPVVYHYDRTAGRWQFRQLGIWRYVEAMFENYEYALYHRLIARDLAGKSESEGYEIFRRVAGAEEKEGIPTASIGGEGLREPYYTPVNNIKIYYRSVGFVNGVDLSGNKIIVHDFGNEGEHPVNDEGDNLEDGGFLFKGRNNEICFFPTIKGGGTTAEATEDGIDNDWFSTKLDDRTIRNGLTSGRLNWCRERSAAARSGGASDLQATPTGKVVFIPVNWGDTNLPHLMELQFEYYSEFYGVHKEPVYVQESCAIPALEQSSAPVAEMKSCAEIFGADTGLSRDELARNALLQCAKEQVGDFSDTTDVVVGVVENEEAIGAEGFHFNGVIFLHKNADTSTLAHESGHRDFNYCDEYYYGDIIEEKEFIKCYEETPLSAVDYAEQEFRSIPQKDNPQLEIADEGTPTITFSIINGLGTMEINYVKNDNRVIQTWDRVFRQGWLLQYTQRGCPNQYPSCCTDSPGWIEPHDSRTNPYGINCYPDNVPLPPQLSAFGEETQMSRNEVLRIAGCSGGPCANPFSPQCRSIMGIAGTGLPRGLPR